MSGQVVNLNQARKKRKREEAASSAAANRARFGRSKQEKAQEAAQARLADRKLEGHRLSHEGAES